MPLADSLTSTDISQPYDTDPSRTELSASSSVTSHTAPLIIDSSMAKGPFGSQASSAVNDSAVMNDNTSYTFQAPANTTEPSPIRPASGINVAAPVDLASPVGGDYYPHFAPRPALQWSASQMNQGAGEPLDMSAAPPIPSNFSPSAAVFTPATSTPPYSLSTTPAVMGPLPFSENSATTVYDPSARTSVAQSSTYQGTNGYQTSFDHGQRRNHRFRQSISHAHGDQRNGHGPLSYQGNGHSQGRSRTATGTEGLFAPLLAHLTTLFDHGSMSDWKIVISSPEDAFRPIYLAVHGAIISRNPVLCALIQQHGPRNKNEIHIKWSDTFIHPSSFSYAVRYLYNESCPSKEEVEMMSNPGVNGPSPRHLQLHWSLSYYLAGHMLNLGPVIKHGRDLVKAFLDWDLLEIAMHWAIDYRPKVYHEMTDTAASSSLSRTSSVHSNYSEQMTAASRPKLVMPHSEAFRLKTLENGSPLVISQPVSDLLLEQVVFFLAYRVAFESFVLDPTAKATEMRSRLPLTRELASVNRSSFRNFALQGISFGDFATGPKVDPFSSEYQNYVASVAFLNLPFDQLKGLLMLLQRRNDPRGLEFAKQVIADRENLRNQVIRSKSVSAHEREVNLVDWYEAGFQEHINVSPPAGHIDSYQPQLAQGFRLDRIWKGLRNPSTVDAGGNRTGLKKRNLNKGRDSYQHRLAESHEGGFPQHVTSEHGNFQGRIG